MALNEIERGVRDLIRSVMRSSGLQHFSYKHNSIQSVTFRHAGSCIHRVVGQIGIRYNKENYNISLYAYKQGRQFENPFSQWAYDITMTYFNSTNWDLVERLDIDIYDPDCSDKMKKFMDKHVQAQHRRPLKNRPIIDSTRLDERPTVSLFGKIKTRIYMLFFKRYETYWIHAIARHMQIPVEKVAPIVELVQEMRIANEAPAVVKSGTECLIKRK